MAIIEVKVPQLSESVAEASLLQWHKKVGDAVTRDENLIDIETDKVVLEVPAQSDGVITQILRENSSTVVAGEVIAMIDTEAKASTAAIDETTAKTSDGVARAAAATTSLLSSSSAKSGDIAMPAAAKMLTENNLSTSSIAGSGKGGRVTKGDVLNHLEQKSASASATTQASNTATTNATTPSASVKPSLPPVIATPTGEWLANRPEERVPMSRLRARIAERLLLSQSSNAILTTFNEANMQPVMELRARYKDKFEKEHGVKLGFMSFFVKAVVAALKKYPIINASVDGNDIVYHGYFDIGIAVGSPRGLVVPILRDADQMSIADIEKKIGEFGNKAKEGKLTLDDLTGGTFSISNGGIFGSMLSTPIINPPQSAILGIHATKERAVVEDGQIVIRPMNYLALSYDHRIIDGREAVLGLVAMKEALEDPARLLLDL